MILGSSVPFEKYIYCLGLFPQRISSSYKNMQQGNRVEIVVKGNGDKEKRRVRKPDETMDEVTTKLSCHEERFILKLLQVEHGGDFFLPLIPKEIMTCDLIV